MSLTESKKRGSYLHIGNEQNGLVIPPRTRPVWITGYSQSGKFICRLEISAAGIAVFKGVKGKKMVGDYTWEKFIQTLEQPAKKPN